jgi:MFS family permease
MTQQKFSKRNQKIRFILFASLAAFGTYFCMYAFRKPFSVATFEGLSYWGVDYKILLILAQVFGYTLSKMLGVKIISEMDRTKRLYILLFFIGFAELALLGFALTPAPWNILFLFLNGLPLGMIWGIVVSYLEGRKTSEVLGVILASSFIVSSGVVKSIGKFLLDNVGISEFWMPFLTGLLFILPIIAFAFMLEKIPPPSEEDIELKSERTKMNGKERFEFYRSYALPLTLFLLLFIMLTAARDFRDNFAREIWDAVGYSGSSAVYSVSEIPIAVSVLLILALVGNIRHNRRALSLYHLTTFLGGSLIILSTLLFQSSLMNAMAWMIISGFGIYISYLPFNGIYFDRLIAVFKIRGNIGFLIYFFDSFGYLGSVLILLYKNFGHAELSWLKFFINGLYLLGFTDILATTLSVLYFNRKLKKI